jgi:hypothetical protein
MNGDTIFHFVCPECKVTNSFNIGDTEDLTIADMEVGECYNCQHKWFWEDEVPTGDIDEDRLEIDEYSTYIGEKV